MFPQLKNLLMRNKETGIFKLLWIDQFQSIKTMPTMFALNSKEISSAEPLVSC